MSSANLFFKANHWASLLIMISPNSSFGKPKTPELIADMFTESTFVSFANFNMLMMQLLSKLWAYILSALKYSGPTVWITSEPDKFPG